tara:strand:- start:1002 stop:1178 length:177 start_codon:yes stop_codon:yes gene_type:complete
MYRDLGYHGAPLRVKLNADIYQFWTVVAFVYRFTNIFPILINFVAGILEVIMQSGLKF